MQGTRVRSLVREGSTRGVERGITTTEPELQGPPAATTEACTPRTRAPQDEPPQGEAQDPKKEQRLLTATRDSPSKATRLQRSHK